MKFATLALIGAVAATEESELIGKRFRWRHIPALMEQERRIGETMESMKPDFEKMGAKIAASLEGKFEKYVPELEAWSKSPAMRIKKWHDKQVAKGQNAQDLGTAMRTVEEDMGMIHWAAGFDQDGYAEWINNEDLADLLDDVYAVKEAFKKLIESKEAMVNHHIGKATLNNKHFRKIVEMFFDDMGVESWEELGEKLEKMAMKAAKKMSECPKMQKLFKQIMRLVKMAERTQEIFDVPSEKDVKAWLAERDFQPWI